MSTFPESDIQTDRGLKGARRYSQININICEVKNEARLFNRHLVRRMQRMAYRQREFEIEIELAVYLAAADKIGLTRSLYRYYSNTLYFSLFLSFF